MNRKDKVLVLYDADEEYSHLMCEYLMSCKQLPWKIAACTSREDLDRLCDGVRPEVILSSGSLYEEGLESRAGVKLIILNDGENTMGLPAVEKYQPAEETLRGVLKIYSQYVSADDAPELLTDSAKAKLIGVFSPIRRCYQTTFSVLMGRLLLERGRVLYLSFEFCEGYEELACDESSGNGNLSDLTYFIKSPQSIFSIRFKSMVKSIAGLDYIPCAVSGTDIAEIPEEEWKTFITRICVMENYSYVVLDLSENVRGIFGVLRMCDRIYTIAAGDRVAKRKIEIYEEALEKYDYPDVKEKSIMCRVPSVKRVPSFLGEMRGGELIDYIRAQIGDI